MNKGTRMIAMAMMLGMAAAAGAQDTEVGDGHLTVTVRYADLDLQKPAGLVELHRRLRFAAKTVCPHNGPGERFASSPRKCREQAIDAAVTRLPATVRAYHAQWREQGSNWIKDVETPAVQFASLP